MGQISVESLLVDFFVLNLQGFAFKIDSGNAVVNISSMTNLTVQSDCVNCFSQLNDETFSAIVKVEADLDALRVAASSFVDIDNQLSVSMTIK
jgi:hypothetical protein